MAMHSDGGRSTWRRAIAGRVQGGWARYRIGSCSISACSTPFTRRKTSTWRKSLQHMSFDSQKPAGQSPQRQQSSKLPIGTLGKAVCSSRSSKKRSSLGITIRARGGLRLPRTPGGRACVPLLGIIPSAPPGSPQVNATLRCPRVQGRECRAGALQRGCSIASSPGGAPLCHQVIASPRPPRVQGRQRRAGALQRRAHGALHGHLVERWEAAACRPYLLRAPKQRG